MNKQLVMALKVKSREIATNFSNPNREFNHNHETFKVEEIIPLSEKTALTIFNKSSGKKAIAFLYYVNYNGGQWSYFIPTESHVYGMSKVQTYLQQIEEHNIKQNEV